MADLHQFRTVPEEPLDCIYILQSTDNDPLSGLEFSAKERKSLRTKAKALGPRGEEGELISGECPLDLARRVTFVGIGSEKDITHSRMRETLNRVMRQATKNREYQIALGVPVKVHGLTAAGGGLWVASIIGQTIHLVDPDTGAAPSREWDPGVQR